MIDFKKSFKAHFWMSGFSIWSPKIIFSFFIIFSLLGNILLPPPPPRAFVENKMKQNDARCNLQIDAGGSKFGRCPNWPEVRWYFNVASKRCQMFTYNGYRPIALMIIFCFILKISVAVETGTIFAPNANANPRAFDRFCDLKTSNYSVL